MGDSVVGTFVGDVGKIVGEIVGEEVVVGMRDVEGPVVGTVVGLVDGEHPVRGHPKNAVGWTYPKLDKSLFRHVNEVQP